MLHHFSLILNTNLICLRYFLVCSLHSRNLSTMSQILTQKIKWKKKVQPTFFFSFFIFLAKLVNGDVCLLPINVLVFRSIFKKDVDQISFNWQRIKNHPKNILIRAHYVDNQIIGLDFLIFRNLVWNPRRTTLYREKKWSTIKGHD